MELLERYLQAVSRHLPRGRQQDILAELRANFEAQLEDKEAELGRGLKQGEAEDWLRELGSPMQVAAQYLPQQWLIGPGIFPAYWFVLRTALLWAAVIFVLVSAVLIVLGQAGAPSVPWTILRFPWVLFQVAAWVTLVFAGMEFFAARFPARGAGVMREVTEWSPATLPPLEKQNLNFVPRSFAHAVAEFVFGCLLLVWLALLPEYPFLVLGPGAWYLQASPFAPAGVVMVFYYWVLALNALQVTWHGVELALGKWQRARRVQHIVIKAIGLIPLVVLLRAPGHVLVLLKRPEVDAAHYGGTVAAANADAHEGLLVALVIVVAQLAWDLWKWVAGLRRGGAGKYA